MFKEERGLLYVDFPTDLGTDRMTRMRLQDAIGRRQQRRWRRRRRRRRQFRDQPRAFVAVAGAFRRPLPVSLHAARAGRDAAHPTRTRRQVRVFLAQAGIDNRLKQDRA